MFIYVIYSKKTKKVYEAFVYEDICQAYFETYFSECDTFDWKAINITELI